MGSRIANHYAKVTQKLRTSYSGVEDGNAPLVAALGIGGHQGLDRVQVHVPVLEHARTDLEQVL